MLAVLSLLSAQSPAIDDSSYARRGYTGFGTIVARAGDVDRDGTPDFIVGDKGAAPDDDALRLWILSGKDGGVLQRIALPGVDAWNPSVDGGVDVDGDGVPDVLVGSELNVESSRPRVQLFSGKTSALLRSVEVGGRPCTGTWAHFIGDFDGDGVPEIAWLETRSGQKRATLTIYSVKKGSALAEISVDNECDDTLGAFADMGDLDDDGTRDFVVLLGCAFGDRSIARACSGAKGSVLWAHRPTRTRSGTHAALSVLASIDRARPPDIVLGIFDEVDLICGKTAKLALSLPIDPRGKPGQTKWKLPFSKPESSPGFGQALVDLGDIDGDGVPDFAVAETDWGGRVVAESGANGNEIWSSETPDPDALYHLGWQLAVIGDINGDHIPDLVAGTCGYLAQAAGQAFVFSGRDGTLLMQLKRWGNDVRVTRRFSSAAKAR
jgi:hypothetical protein